MRLSHFLAIAGVASRRSAESIILAGRVSINGKVVAEPYAQIRLGDVVEIDGLPVTPPDKIDRVYIMLHKPVGVVSTMKSNLEQGLSITDLVQHPLRIFPIGRLDRNTSGLLLLTNDGDLAYRLTHPSHKIQKEYLLRTHPHLKPRDVRRLMQGVSVDGRVVEVDGIYQTKGDYISITIHEGRKHVVRRLMKETGYKVIELKRIRIGPLSLGRLSAGRWRKLRASEIESLIHEVSDCDEK